MPITIHLNDTSAHIVRVTPDQVANTTTVDLEWGGPSDRTVDDFELRLLGHLATGSATGGTLRSGWVILQGPCRRAVGDFIPARRASDEDA